MNPTEEEKKIHDEIEEKTKREEFVPLSLLATPSKYYGNVWSLCPCHCDVKFVSRDEIVIYTPAETITIRLDSGQLQVKTKFSHDKEEDE